MATVNIKAIFPCNIQKVWEVVTVKNPVMKLFVKSYLKKQQAAYIKDLWKALGI